ncbi:MAG: acetate kinase [Clostridiales bacterium]|jgi:acetate kinase|nr:acetate kinase [Clostridiales bacterium]
MKILVLNCGSSSLKYQLVDMETEAALARGLVERIGIENSRLVHETDAGKVEMNEDIPNHQVAVQLAIDALISPEYGVISDVKEISAAGHRVVHGGENFSEAVIIDGEVKKAIAECSTLAPLHNPANLVGIEACERILDVKQVAVFDTAFHQTMPDKAFMYALPYGLYEKYKIRRYGFHGTSHKYVAARAAALLGRPLDELKLISCHLGNGASVCAIDKGLSVDTSMGLTPLEGLIMGTRAGDMDPAAVTFIMEKERLSPGGMEGLLNKTSGVLGISGLSSDFRDLEAARNEGNEMADLAIKMYCYRVAKYIGAYAAAMNGVDGIIFTAGVGENGSMVRREICEYLGFLGVSLDEEKNAKRGVEIDASAEGARVRALVIPTNEELTIARETLALVK